jgi:hypothetical protein
MFKFSPTCLNGIGRVRTSRGREVNLITGPGNALAYHAAYEFGATDRRSSRNANIGQFDAMTGMEVDTPALLDRSV